MRKTRFLCAAMAALLATCPVTLPGSAYAASPSPPDEAPTAFDEIMRRGDMLLAAGDDVAAETAFREALQTGPEGDARADALHKLAISLAQQEKFVEAEPAVLEAEALARALRGDGNVLLADVLRAKTVVLYRTGRVEEARAAFREAKRILEDHADAWRTEPDGATWLHRPSAQKFRERYGAFVRLRRTMLDDTGRNVVVHYRVGSEGPPSTLVSVYISVDRGVPLKDEFDATAVEIIRRFPNATILSNGSRTVAQADQRLTGFEALMELPPEGDGRVRRTSLGAFEKGNVMFRFRASYPATEAPQRQPEVDRLVEVILAGGL